jgi:predicted DCC family thiol-disulfide oxidoreductase YuxK
MPTMIFDGVCVLCSGGVRFVLRHERDNELVFATTQSATGRALAARHGISTEQLDVTFVLVEGERAYVRSDAALRVAKHLAAPWRWLGVFRLVPGPIRDAIYSWVARRRYRMFGRYDTCMIPATDQRHRFILE